MLAFFPLILLSVLRLSAILSLVSGILSAITYLISAYSIGWRFTPGPTGFTVTQTAVVYFSLVLLITGVIASQIALEIRTHVESALKDAETKHQLQQIEHELQIARSIQQSLLPKFRPHIEGFQVAGWSRTATDTGGDFYDWKQLADGRWVMILADVTGHGIGPAILASVCRAYSRANLNVRAGLETILNNINRSFAEDLTPKRFATFVAVLCQEGSDELELLSAGHGPILIYSAKERSLSALEAQALPLIKRSASAVIGNVRKESLALPQEFPSDSSPSKQEDAHSFQDCKKRNKRDYAMNTLSLAFEQCCPEGRGGVPHLRDRNHNSKQFRS